MSSGRHHGLSANRTRATAESRPCDTDSSNRDSLVSRFDPVVEIEVETDAVRMRQARRHKRFLKGPIAMPAVATAARLPGAALALLLAIYHRTALTGKGRVTLPASLMAELGINRDAKARGLRQLEAAGLIHVERPRGQNATIILTTSQPQSSKHEE